MHKMASRHHCILGYIFKIITCLSGMRYFVYECLHTILSWLEVLAVSAVLLSRKLTWMTRKSVPQNSHHECRQKVHCGISLAVVVDFSTCYHKLLFYQYTVLSLQLHTSINFWLFQFSVCVVLKTI